MVHWRCKEAHLGVSHTDLNDIEQIPLEQPFPLSYTHPAQPIHLDFQNVFDILMEALMTLLGKLGSSLPSLGFSLLLCGGVMIWKSPPPPGLVVDVCFGCYSVHSYKHTLTVYQISKIK